LAAQEQGWGLLNMVDLPEWLEVLIGVLVLDLVVYLQHDLAPKKWTLS
jgi:sterol desaturase/sphingolipid hydroxylase (fatty acid hydroxylase superfamily)